MKPLVQDRADVFQTAALDIEALRRLIAFGLALEKDASLSMAIRSAAGIAADRPLVLKVANSDGGLLLSPDGSCTPISEADALSAPLEELLAEYPRLYAQVVRACDSASVDALTVLRPLVEPLRMPTRPEFLAMARWSPLISRAAYLACARLVDVMEAARPEALAVAGDAGARALGPLSRYYGLAQLMAHLVLIASAPGERQWLADMAKSFEWVRWTPSVALVRERTLWLSAASVRSAAAFGPEVFPLYFGALARARHPMMTFDALLGLVSIACSHEQSFDDVADEVDGAFHSALRREDPHLPYTMLAFHSAINTMRRHAEGLDPPSSLFGVTGWRGGESLGGLATPRALRLDPSDSVASGEMIGLLAIPTILAEPLSAHYPVRVGANVKLLPAGAELLEVLHRAWAPGSRTVH